MARRGLLFQIVFHPMTINSESMVCIKPGDSGMEIGYKDDEFTQTLLAEHSVAQSHNYLGLTGKVSH